MKIYEELKQLEFFKWLDEVHNLADTDMKPEYLDKLPIDDIHRTVCNAMVFRWFREKHNYHVIIDFNQSKNNKWYYGIIQIDHNISVSPDVEFETYEEAELAALKELIKTIKDRT
jgi:hypothetical protein